MVSNPGCFQKPESASPSSAVVSNGFAKKRGKRTRSQGQNVRVDQLLLEPGEIGLLPIKEAADRIDQNMVGRRCSQTTGLFE